MLVEIEDAEGVEVVEECLLLLPLPHLLIHLPLQLTHRLHILPLPYPLARLKFLWSDFFHALLARLRKLLRQLRRIRRR